MSQNSSTQSHSTTTGLAALLRYAAKQHGVISAAEAANFEVTRAQLRSGVRRGDWLTPHAGVLIAAAAPATWMQRCMIATQRSGGLISHRAAARLHGLDGFHGSESGGRIVGGSGGEAGLVELTVPDSRSRAIGDFLVHRTCVLAPEDCTVTAGIAVTSIARTLVDLGAVVSDDKVEQALDDAIRRGYSLRWITETLNRVDRPGPSGCASLRRVLARPDRQGPIPDSMFERSMDRMAVAGGMPQPERQFRVYDGLGFAHGGLGILVAQLDAAWPAVKLGVEAHSSRWHDGNRRGRADQRRDNRLAGLGWELLYLSWWDLQHPATFQSDLAAAYALRC
jgi:predicted transcriptional regulator of viral defense system